MYKFFKRKLIVSQDSFLIQKTRASNHSSKQNRFDLKTLSTYPGLQLLMK